MLPKHLIRRTTFALLRSIIMISLMLILDIALEKTSLNLIQLINIYTTNYALKHIEEHLNSSNYYVKITTLMARTLLDNSQVNKSK